MRSGTLRIEYEQAYCCVCHYRAGKLPNYPLAENWPNKENLCIPQKYHVPFTRNLRAGFEFVLVSFCSPTSFSVKGHVPSGVPQGGECSCPAIIERHCLPGTILGTLQTVSHSFLLEDAVTHNVQVTRQAGTCLGPQTWNLNPGHFREEKQKGDTFLLIWSDLQDIVCISKEKNGGGEQQHIVCSHDIKVQKKNQGGGCAYVYTCTQGTWETSNSSGSGKGFWKTGSGVGDRFFTIYSLIACAFLPWCTF